MHPICTQDSIHVGFLLHASVYKRKEPYVAHLQRVTKQWHHVKILCILINHVSESQSLQVLFWSPMYLLTECTLDYDHCQVNWFMHFVLWTTDQNDHSTKPMAYHNSEQVYEPRLHSVSTGYKHTFCQQIPLL